MVAAYVNSRLIPLNKNPGIRPIGVGEVLRRIIGKTISRHTMDKIKEAAGPLQTCAGFGAVAEAAVHAMRATFEADGTDAVMLIDAENAFNSLNRSAALHNIRIICPEITTYLLNMYRKPSELFITGGETILSQEGTTQGDPLAMPWYSLATTTIINHLQECFQKQVKQVWLADDASAAGKLEDLVKWYKELIEVGKDHGYHVNKGKCWLIVKNQQLEKRAKRLFGDTVNVTTEGQRHLGAVIGSKSYKDSYCENKVDKWRQELGKLTEIAKTEPQAAYAAFTKAYKSKFTFFQRTIIDFEEYLEPVDSLLYDSFIPTLFGSSTPPEIPSSLIALNPKDGGLGIQKPS